MLPGLAPSIVTSLGPATVFYAAQAVNAANLSSYTFSALNLGEAAGSRFVVVGVLIAYTGTPTITGVTIGGVAASPIGSAAAASNVAVQFWGAQVGTGASGDVVVTTSAAVLGCGVGIWALYDLKSQTPVDTDTSLASTGACTLTTIPGGIALGIAGHGGDLRSYTWTGVVENFDGTVDGGSEVSFSGGSVAVEDDTSIEITATRSASHSTPAMAAVTFR